MKRLYIFQVNLAFRTVADEDLPATLSTIDGKEAAMFNFEEFCCLVAEFKFKVRNKTQKHKTFLFAFLHISFNKIIQ